MQQNADPLATDASEDGASNLRSRLDQAYGKIRDDRFSIFPSEGERSATPLNSYPFHVSWANLHADWAFTARRAKLVENLQALHQAIIKRDIRPAGFLIGGSFSDRSVEDPRDIDAVSYYAGHVAVQKDLLSTLQRKAKRELSIDTRFIPVDTDPLLLIRATAFFSLLYSKKEGSNQITRPLIFLDTP